MLGITVPATLTLPSIALNTGSKPRIELITDTKLYVRRNQVLELGLTKGVLSTTLQGDESMTDS